MDGYWRIWRPIDANGWLLVLMDANGWLLVSLDADKWVFVTIDGYTC